MGKCKSCDGDGYVNCPKCNGKGYKTNFDAISSALFGTKTKDVECNLCSGSGRKTCGACDGSGKNN